MLNDAPWLWAISPAYYIQNIVSYCPLFCLEERTTERVHRIRKGANVAIIWKDYKVMIIGGGVLG